MTFQESLAIIRQIGALASECAGLWLELEAIRIKYDLPYQIMLDAPKDFPYERVMEFAMNDHNRRVFTHMAQHLEEAQAIRDGLNNRVNAILYAQQAGDAL